MSRSWEFQGAPEGFLLTPKCDATEVATGYL